MGGTRWGEYAPGSAQRDAILATVPDARERAVRTLDWFKANIASWAEEASVFGSFPSLYMGLVHETGDAGTLTASSGS